MALKRRFWRRRRRRFQGVFTSAIKEKEEKQSKPSHQELTERLVSGGGGGEEEESLRLPRKKKMEQEEGGEESLRLPKKKKKKEQDEGEESLRLPKKKKKKKKEQESLRLPKKKKKKKKEQEEEEEFSGSSLRLSKEQLIRDLTKSLASEIRIVVQKEFQNLLGILGSPPFLTLRPPTKTQKVARFQLHFDNKLPSTLFTDREIMAEDGNPILIVIRDINSREIVSSGPLSALKIKVVVLDGEFCDDGQEWTEDEFLGHIKSERKGKRPLLTGGLDMSLSNGVGHLRDASFTDNSSWTKSGFRLGVGPCKDFSKGQRVREAISEAFKVKDCRVELNQKDRHPRLDDEVYHLRKIGRNGPFHMKLLAAQIKTVQDFLRLLTVDPDGLRELFGRGMTNKSWKTVVDHARGCSLGNKRYSYPIKGENVILVFDSIFQLVGAVIDGLYQSLACLTPSQKELVDNLKGFAYKNYKDIDEFHGTQNVPPIPASNVSPLEISDPGISYGIQQPESSFTDPSLCVQLPDEPIDTNVSLVTPHHPQLSLQRQPIPQSNEHSSNQYKEASDGQGLRCAQQPDSHVLYAPSCNNPSPCLQLPDEPIDTIFSIVTPHHSQLSLQLSLQHQPIPQSNEHSSNQYKEVSLGSFPSLPSLGSLAAMGSWYASLE